MTDRDDRDPVVARALALLPVPDHQPGFWARLEEALAAEDAGDTAATLDAEDGGGEDAQLARVVDLRAPRRQGRAPHRVGWLAAAAALVALAVAGTVIFADDGRNVGVATSPTTSAGVTTTVPPGTSAGPAVEPGAAGEAVLAWVDALGAGDRERAASLLGPGSVDHIGSLGRQPVEFMTELSEGYGAWSASTDRSTAEVTVPTSGEGTVEVVVLTGTVEQEGTTAHRTVALPVRSSGPTHRVEPLDFSDGETRLELVSPAPGPEGPGGLAADGMIELYAPSAGQVAVSLDGGDVHTPAVGPYGQVRFDPPGELSPGTHLLVVASIGAEHLTALAVTFPVEG